MKSKHESTIDQSTDKISSILRNLIFSFIFRQHLNKTKSKLAEEQAETN